MVELGWEVIAANLLTYIVLLIILIINLYKLSIFKKYLLTKFDYVGGLVKENKV